MSASSAGRGRKHPQFYTENFECLGQKDDKSGRYIWKCKHCGDKPQSKDPRKCPKAPTEASAWALRELAAKKPMAQPEPATANTDEVGMPNTPSADITDSSKKRKTATMDQYVDRALTPTQQTDADRKWTRFIVHANVPFLASEDEYLDDFFESVRPSYTPPSRYAISHSLLDAEAAEALLAGQKRAQATKMLTMLHDGWEDRLKRSIYGVVAAAMEEAPTLMALNDVTGARGNAQKYLDVAVAALKVIGIPDAKNFIALTTDNPTTMQAFRRIFQEKYHWVLTFACFLHSLNTIVGEICTYAPVKTAVSHANRVVTFFNGSHYWGRQLQAEAERLHITRGLKKNCESRWYTLILLCLSVSAHRQPLSITCLREDAQRKTQGLSAVAEDVITAVLRDSTFWPLLMQVTRVCKPIVDAIGNCESRETTLADCMLELLRCARTLATMRVEDGKDLEFLAHARDVFDRRFARIATPKHWLALFLHPNCRKLALSGNTASGRGKTIDFMITTAVEVAHQWRWIEEKTKAMCAGLRCYGNFLSPFVGKAARARPWWVDMPRDYTDLKTLAIVFCSIVPHSADVERLFSQFGGIQSPRRSNMTVDTMEKLGRVRGHLNLLLSEKHKLLGKPTRRKHAHMHTNKSGGINTDLAASLETPTSWIPPLETGNEAEEDQHDIVDKAYRELKATIAAEGAGEGADTGSVVGGQVVDFEELERVNRGDVEVGEEVLEIIGGDVPGSWNIADMLRVV
uniref:DUF659 domain-containing protein n=1 Tax=Mycena chlorophos TaxID=658473 RepID=A0ABQ0KWP2_MYCCL|nr:predicted protein [Mycena chlorophos]